MTIRSIFRWTLKWRSSPPDLPIIYAKCWTWDGRDFWMVDVNGTLYQVDSQTGRVKLALLLGLGTNITAIAWAGKSLYLTSSSLAMIYQVNPHTGRVIQFASTPGASPSGLCWDGRTLWLSDAGTQCIYQLSVT